MSDYDAEILRYIAIIIFSCTISSLVNQKLGIIVSIFICVLSFISGMLFFIAGAGSFLFNAFVTLPISAWVGLGAGHILRKIGRTN
ncbi:hypothetical protein [Sphingopyxis sp. JAI128]|uniref:hypothetical protein n=1 Tax=Sphingopyxis sp. JAI128 TaxID=2723066 RepID=UPI0016083D59|nr:hypothetical protein [Sphingopyxis sp. JAI128]MBB6428025.1 K+-sensing histidine kinase KdpD [Sphingopyxis sp. JAI128]